MRSPAGWLLTAVVAGLLAGAASAPAGGDCTNSASVANGTILIGNGTTNTFVPATIGGTTGFLGVSNGAGTITLGSSAADANGLGACQVIQRSFSLAGNGADLSIYTSNAPFAFTVLDTWVLVTTAQTSSVGTLRSATGGLGTALSQALSTAATGYARNTTFTGVSGALPTVPANGTLVFRVSGASGATAVAGNVMVFIQR